MGQFSSQDIDKVARDVGAIPEIQGRLRANASDTLKVPDRVAHQYQIAGGKVSLGVATGLPENLEGVGLFEPGSVHTGVARVSTGLGCPHRETAPDFLGLRLAFLTRDGHRVDFIGINDPTSPTDDHVQFMELLKGTAKGAGRGTVASTVALVLSLIRGLGVVRGLRVAGHVARQTKRAAVSSTAYQTYWTGVVETGGVPGKFVIKPVRDENAHRRPAAGPRHLTEEWRERQARGAIEFDLSWIPFVDDRATSLAKLTRAWEERPHRVGRVTFPPCDHRTEEARLWAALAAEMGANSGNWVRDRGNTIPEPGTAFGLARKIAYAKSQEGRSALPEADYAHVFSTGVIGEPLAAELRRRREEKRRLGHVDVAP